MTRMAYREACGICHALVCEHTREALLRRMREAAPATDQIESFADEVEEQTRLASLEVPALVKQIEDLRLLVASYSVKLARARGVLLQARNVLKAAARMDGPQKTAGTVLEAIAAFERTMKPGGDGTLPTIEERNAEVYLDEAARQIKTFRDLLCELVDDGGLPTPAFEWMERARKALGVDTQKP
jgi:hypothetical protein